ncbi:helix-turn-helix domain-containing protein [Actinomadura sp. ATCC 31491]|uniref:Helix-turn-helix domain-containing protein n=1 Tax=Actinomadura luzonensis TaxID=2805427 RepID=A0ABT0FUS2_9ACTN|nr:ArsR family transcriptional regulator [Actinomadura luzonensis]MCK2216086.1 helix-turn-helix domain-containing protein [Actinomadura luzonensis]
MSRTKADLLDDDRVPRHPDLREVTLQQVLEALVDPVRRSIVTRLRDVPGDVRCGSFDLPVSKSTATHHFRVLREAGLIRQYYVGTARMNALRRDEFDAAFPGLLDAVVAAERAAAGAGV